IMTVSTKKLGVGDRVRVRWTKTAGGASDSQGKLSLKGGTLKIENISRHQGGRYYCKAENGLGFPAIRSIRVDVYCKHSKFQSHNYDFESHNYDFESRNYDFKSHNYDFQSQNYDFESRNLDKPVITVHQSDDEAKEQFYFERTVFLRCAANSNPPVHYTWTRDREVLAQGSDSGVEIYKPFFTQQCGMSSVNQRSGVNRK
uniref:Ig-like domain-containing protein n=1 Tax=Poecilia formosa TaxID=48698 RepID=A0A096MIB8_POEFO